MANGTEGNGKAKTIIGLAKESIVGAALIGVSSMFLGHMEKADTRSTQSYDKLSTAIQSLESGIRERNLIFERILSRFPERTDGK